MNRLLTAIAVALLVAGISVFHFTCDDAWIAFRYAHNLLEGRGLVWNPAPFPPVEGYTSFFWVVICAAGWGLTGIPIDGAASATRAAECLIVTATVSINRLVLTPITASEWRSAPITKPVAKHGRTSKFYGDFAATRDGHYRNAQMQGRMQLGASRTLVIEGQEGWLRFPSGVRLPWTCEDQLAVIVEPEWLQVSVDADLVAIDIDPIVNSVDVGVHIWLEFADGRRTLRAASPVPGDAGSFTLAAPAPDDRIDAALVLIDGRPVPRWWPAN